jgi:hypothetical protein
MRTVGRSAGHSPAAAGSRELEWPAGEDRYAAVAMSNLDTSIGWFYEGWQIYNERIVEVIRDLSAQQLGVRPAPERWPL